MKIVSWNCRNGLDEVKAGKIHDLFNDADIFVLQECRRSDIYTLKDSWKFKNWYGDDQEYSDLGVAVFSKKYNIEFIDEFNRSFRYVIPYNIKINQKCLTLFAVWTKPVPHYYDQNVIEAVNWYESKKQLTGDTIIIGDFNTGVSDDHQEYYSNLCKNLKGFKNAASGTPKESIETFYFSRKNQMYINDFCFISDSLYNSLKGIEVHNDWEENNYKQKNWNGSDHCPISVEFEF